MGSITQKNGSSEALKFTGNKGKAGDDCTSTKNTFPDPSSTAHKDVTRKILEKKIYCSKTVKWSFN